jgi:RNA polymerase sigma factor (sigma-70 family)
MPEACKKFDPKVATDVELANAVAGKDESAYLELQQRHSTLVRRVIRGVLSKGCFSPDHHGENIESESWFRIWKYARPFDESRGTVEAYLATVARNRAYTHLSLCLEQKQKEGQADDLTFESFSRGQQRWADTYDLPQVVQDWELVESVQRGLSDLHLVVVTLGLFEKVPYQEISSQLNISVVRIKVIIYRFKQACRELAESNPQK